MTFPPTRTAALERLSKFVPKSGRDYAAKRNFDLGPGRHDHVSTLSPYLRHRLITEREVVEAVLGRYSLSSAEKFVQEVYWRTYWKGWLELRPSIWMDYRTDVKAGLNRLQTESGLRAEFDAACAGETDIECFNFWAQELVNTGYLHNHARMWFASIWVFTLRLPWALGADFFLRHLLDGDPASNTLSWRWIAGMQTKGKTYLARPSNIAKFTDGRFQPSGRELASDAPALDSPDNPPVGEPPYSDHWTANLPTALLISEDDMSPGFMLDRGLKPQATASFSAASDRSPLVVSPRVTEFTEAALDDCTARYGDRLGNITKSPEDLLAWVRDTGAEQVVTAYAPTGPAQERLDTLERQLKDHNIPLIRILRDEDSAAWPYATHGFFKFKEKIPKLVGELKGLRAAS
ncbi:deoxyribodipyrimidine photo-lyase [Litoreibacter ponti]|uniref:Deoxyribodipyrimidine photo-lyase n=1 Tax=Litoreibacter ponti TaxID=1510457 RepID=A0A2T6BJN9_9RHOB|nr:FAD-binding domain-containing protein [Litoreibacter ponti]PTX56280.1 deoxyribodipyrimidine photo-lyase [Litoreibacter ponti]